MNSTHFLQAETEQESVKQSGPASRLTNRKATKKRKKPSRTSPEDRTVRALTSEPLKKNSLERREAGQEAGVTLNDLNPYEIGRRSRHGFASSLPPHLTLLHEEL